MPDAILALFAVALVASLVVIGVLVHPRLRGRRVGPRDGRVDADPAPPPVPRGVPEAPPDDPGRSGLLAGYDRMVRGVSYVVLLASAAAVGVSGQWSDVAPVIYLTLALAGLSVFVVHDLLPPALLGPRRFLLQGVLAIAFLTVLISLTGGATSPFFFLFELGVAGAALTLGTRAAAALTAVASAAFLVAVAAAPGFPALTRPQLVGTALNLLALWLLAGIAAVLARDQRRRRDAALFLSQRDPLTGLYNRAYFFRAVEMEIQRSIRTGRSFSILMMDLDELKSINDTHGHQQGDATLREVAIAIQRSLRQVDTAARYGGDEFIVLLPDTDETGGPIVAEKIRALAARSEGERAVPALGTSLSIGVVVYPRDGKTADALVRAADTAMYESKRTGKNRVTAARPDMFRVIVSDAGRR